MVQPVIHLGADHRGFHLKAELKAWLAELGYSVHDHGADELDKTDDFPDFALPVARAVAAAEKEQSYQFTELGIVLCGSGVGVCIAANKVAGVRSALAWQPEIARLARKDDAVNVLALAADFTSFNEAQTVVQAFLTTAFEATPARKRRVAAMTIQ